MGCEMDHGHSLKEFKAYREKMNEKILERGNLQIKRFFNLDTQAYNDGALSKKTKEMMGLIASLVLRCDDCVTYHIIQCVEQKVSDAEFFETFNPLLHFLHPVAAGALERRQAERRKGNDEIGLAVGTEGGADLQRTAGVSGARCLRERHRLLVTGSHRPTVCLSPAWRAASCCDGCSDPDPRIGTQHCVA